MALPQLKTETTYHARAVYVVPLDDPSGQTEYEDVRVRLVGSGSWLAVIHVEKGDEVLDAYPVHRVLGVFGLSTQPAPPPQAVDVRVG